MVKLSIIVMEVTWENELADNEFNVARLYDYTKFHIGLYATLVSGLLVFVKFMGEDEPKVFLFLITAALFAFAGACGGLICTTCTYVATKEQTINANKVVTLWNKKLLSFELKTLTQWEHKFFWMGIIWAFVSLIFIDLFSS